jgi:Family of unknown function (DUF5675)
MELRFDLRRTRETASAVMGALWLRGLRWLYTLEPSRLTPVHEGHPCIPAGTYRVVLTKSPHLGYICPELLDVPGRSNIRIHKANFPADLLGCIAVGEDQQSDFVDQSGVAFERLMAVLPHYEPIWLTITDPQPPKEEPSAGARGIEEREQQPAASSPTDSHLQPGNAIPRNWGDST